MCYDGYLNLYLGNWRVLEFLAASWASDRMEMVYMLELVVTEWQRCLSILRNFGEGRCGEIFENMLEARYYTED